jgi:hypothetical protein
MSHYLASSIRRAVPLPPHFCALHRLLQAGPQLRLWAGLDGIHQRSDVSRVCRMDEWKITFSTNPAGFERCRYAGNQK